MKKTAETSAPINELLAERWSPRVFDASHALSDTDLRSILEAGRWAPSANNIQPWRFSVARRADELFAQVVGATSGFNQAWLPNASAVILVSIPEVNANGEPYKIAMFDAGLATQNILLQAESMGLYAHVVAGMDREAMAQVLSLEEGQHPVVLIAVGKHGDVESVAGTPLHERETATRTRLPLEQIVLTGLPA
ncbi:MAG: nitroreductase family protein [Micrococcales bacterium]